MVCENCNYFECNPSNGLSHCAVCAGARGSPEACDGVLVRCGQHSASSHLWGRHWNPAGRWLSLFQWRVSLSMGEQCGGLGWSLNMGGQCSGQGWVFQLSESQCGWTVQWVGVGWVFQLSESQCGWTVRWVGVGWVFQLSVSVWVDSAVGGDGVGVLAVGLSVGGQCSGLGWGGFFSCQSQCGWTVQWVGMGWVFQLSVSVWVDSAVSGGRWVFQLSESQHGWTVHWVGVGWGFLAVSLNMGGQCSGQGWGGFFSCQSQHGWTVQWVGMGWGFQLSVSMWVDSAVGGGVGSSVDKPWGSCCKTLIDSTMHPANGEGDVETLPPSSRCLLGSKE